MGLSGKKVDERTASGSLQVRALVLTCNSFLGSQELPVFDQRAKGNGQRSTLVRIQ
jgi:hypothetical protein